MNISEYKSFFIGCHNNLCMEFVPEESKWMVWECIKHDVEFPVDLISLLESPLTPDE